MDEDLIAKALPYTKTGERRLRVTLAALRRVDQEGIEGDFVECGVWRGGHAVLVRLASPNRKCWLYDTFDGMTVPTSVDVRRNGKTALKSYNSKMRRGEKWAGISLDEVRNNFYVCGALDNSLVKFVKGDVCQTLKRQENLPDKIAVLRLDTDWHDSTLTELKVLWPRLVVGGSLLIDDYGHWLGARRAVDEFFGLRAPPWNWVDDTQVCTVKTC